jgi:hypothetical protein
MGVGAFDGWNAIDRFVDVGETVEPHDHDRYGQAYASYRALYPAVKASLPAR